MNAAIFVDTNIIVYSCTDAGDIRHKKAEEFFDNHVDDMLVISTQVLSELYVTLRKHQLSEYAARQTVHEYMSGTVVVPVTVETIDYCFALKKRYGFSYWDCLIISAAILSGCTTLYSEDMQHGQVIESMLEIQNPLLT